MIRAAWIILAAILALGALSLGARWFNRPARHEAANAPADAVLLDQINTLSKAGRHDEAVQACEEALRISPASEAARIALAESLARQGKLDYAVEQFMLAVRANPNSAAARRGLGSALMKQKLYSAAQEQFVELLRIVPGDPVAREGFRQAEHAMQNPGPE